jgi:hypothetical protein
VDTGWTNDATIPYKNETRFIRTDSDRDINAPLKNCCSVIRLTFREGQMRALRVPW